MGGRAVSAGRAEFGGPGARSETNRDDRSRLERFLDPFDVAGRAIRLVPGTPPCALAHVDF